MHFFDISTSKSCPKLSCFARLTWKCASRHNGVQFFISHLGSWLRTRRFSEPTFRPSGATNHWKNSVSRLSYLFAHLHLLSSDSFSSLIFSLLLFSSLFFCSTSAFHLSILSESLTSKLPSIMALDFYAPHKGNHIIVSMSGRTGSDSSDPFPRYNSHIPIFWGRSHRLGSWARIIPILTITITNHN